MEDSKAVTSGGCWTLVNGEWEDRAEHDWRNPGHEQTDDYPVVCVNWNDTQSYVGWLSGRTGNEYRLLSEAEWEYVARAGTTTPFHYGETISDRQANYNGEFTVPVGSYEENDFGLYDVHGNVWEWVQDCWKRTTMTCRVTGQHWSLRDVAVGCYEGGAWNVESAESLRSSVRGWNNDDLRGSFNGFRVAYTLCRYRRVGAREGQGSPARKVYDGNMRGPVENPSQLKLLSMTRCARPRPKRLLRGRRGVKRRTSQSRPRPAVPDRRSA